MSEEMDVSLSSVHHSPAASNTADTLETLESLIRQRAESSCSDTLALLALLRMIERLHREISEGLFQESLPNNRRALYSLLKEIEASGGWPYIYKMRLQSFLKNLEAEPQISDSSDSSSHPI